jgi:hypothetical protein
MAASRVRELADAHRAQIDAMSTDALIGPLLPISAKPNPPYA